MGKGVDHKGAWGIFKGTVVLVTRMCVLVKIPRTIH